MSEPIFPAPAHAAPSDAEPFEEAHESRGNRKALMAVGAVGAVLVAGAAAFLLMSGGSDPADEIAVVAQPVPAATAPAPTAPSPAASVVVKPAKADVSSRDPFRPLFPTAAPQPAPSATAAPAGGGETPTTSGSGAGVSGNPSDGGTVVTLTVAKVDPLGQTATVTVNGKKYPTTVNKVFGKYFVMYSVFNTECVGVLYGDQSVPVCVGKNQTITF